MQQAAEAYAFRQLVAHFQMRTDVQNIELMILSGFCRNCLSKWYHAGVAAQGVAMPYDEACQRVYGMTVAEWKKTHQSKASEEQLRRMEETKAQHAKHAPVVVAPAAQPTVPAAPEAPAAPQCAAPGGVLSDVCCVPAEDVVSRPPQPLATPPPPPPPAPVEIRLGILTVSDRAHAGTYDDLSGPEIDSCMRQHAAGPHGAQWRLAVAARAIVPDERPQIAQRLLEWSEPGAAGGAAACNLILTTGGTGLAPRDVTPEATSEVVERPAPGIVELLLRSALAVEPLAALSRATAGVRGGTLIVNLPGRPKAVRENLATLMPLLPHALLAL